MMTRAWSDWYCQWFTTQVLITTGVQMPRTWIEVVVGVVLMAQVNISCSGIT
jgi:hypothetical protein